MERLTRKFQQVAPEAVVIVGNDQREFFTEELTPSITVYRGKDIRNVQQHHEESSGLNIAEVGNAPEESATYPGAPELADHILRALGDDDFDLAQSSTTPQNAIRHGIPHAFGFLYHSILGDTPPPSVPVILNVHYPHNQPKTARCLELGRALQRAIKSFTGYKRVAMMASGGLTHFVVDEDLDQKVMKAMADRRREGAHRDSREHLQGGHRGNQELVPAHLRDERRGAPLSPGRLRALLSLGSRHRQRDGVCVLGVRGLKARAYG